MTTGPGRLESARRRVVEQERALASARTPTDRHGAAIRLAYARLAVTAATRSQDDATGGPLGMSEIRAFLESFGETRAREGDTFTVAEHLVGHYFYETGEAKTGIAVWGEENDWLLSVFSAARVRMQPTAELHRRVGVWRSTIPLSGCYVIEDGDCAVLCERTLSSSQVVDDVSARLLIRSSIDLVGGFARLLGRDLGDLDGMPYTASGQTGLVVLLGWWEVQDPRITRYVQENG